MSFRIAHKTLESLEWSQVVARLVQHCRTSHARTRLGEQRPDFDFLDTEGHRVEGESRARTVQTGESLQEPSAPGRDVALGLSEFEDSLAGIRDRLSETREARALLEAEHHPPIGGISDLRGSLRRAGMGGVLAPSQLLEIRASLEALRSTTSFMLRHAQTAPLLADLAASIETHSELEREIEHCIDRSGEVRDSASPMLAQARRDVNDLSGQLQQRLARYLQDPEIVDGLSDSYYTVRNDRYVLPVRADHKGKVRGIVHDASRSGGTLFIEPEAVVDLNNRLKQAELTQAREIERVLHELSSAVAAIRPVLEASLEVLSSLDLAFARAHLAIEMQAVEPIVERGGVFVLPQLRHPLLAIDEAVPNDVVLGDHYTVLVISGPNGGGKTVAMKAVGLVALMVRLGLHIPAGEGARVDLVDDILVDIGDGQDLRESLSTFSAHMANLSEIVEAASPHTLALLDEVGVGTDPGEGAALAQAILETLAAAGTRVIATTHYSLLKEMADVDERFCNASVEFDPETLAPTYRLHTGTPGVSSATAVAARMGMSSAVLERAGALLEREDRQLDQMLAELQNSRVTLEREKQEASRLRVEGESVRTEYQHKLERLQERRDKLFLAMREDLDRTFKNAHAQVAAVIRDLQRSGQNDSRSAAQGAAHARERLLSLQEATHAKPSEAEAEAAEAAKLRAIDWRHAKPGIEVIVPGGGRGVLEALPDSKGRVRVRVGSAKLQIESARVLAAEADGKPRPEAARPSPAVSRVSADEVAGGVLECDLRGQRVDEALDRLAEMLDAGLHEGKEHLRIIHGFGTGALRKAVREHLKSARLVASYRAGERGEGGNGVTVATLAR